ncbi:alpha/beta-hydrolase [Karstenula rhodostoma CBS 690.94]|uniref:Pheromone-processing carboxypeptidase KEX1 n=1 Tax=Karstenula rhodostoma CBS 690.94 TaxID=1392251 RepID=A0A9P4P2W1_9PLEO|nr:alpha/beta-hydrolase [Karstenula rhodostoma CBS 690.94]
MLFTTAPSRWRTALLGGLLASLAWLPGGAAEEKTQADYFVHSLPGAPEPLLKMHAGHIEVDAEHNGNLFFWHYENRHIANRQRTVIWLNGGPGCSSMDGALMEIGPYRVREGGKLEYNNGSWDEFANLLFVDQPVGTGFSYVNTDSYLSELDQMAGQFMVFLEKWFALFPEYEQDDLYIAGESYAGQHIPYIARAILNRNKNSQKHQWALNGVLIGNGWISPVDHYLSYLPFAYQSGLLRADSPEAKRVESLQSKCLEVLNEGASDHVDNAACESVMTTILQETKIQGGDPRQECVNMYDIRLRDDGSCGMNWPPDLSTVTPWLRQADVIAALHINSDKKTGWTECNGAVSSHFRAKNSKPSIQFLPELLSQINIVLFSGDQDLICNHIGTESLIDGMTWNGGKGFEISQGVEAPKRDWVFEGEPAGTYREARNLTYVVFYNSSHMVPFDYPRRTRDMLDRFIGVDISAVGGAPSESLLNGEKGPLVSVGGHPNSTKAEEDKTKQLKEAEWKAYYRSGEVALVVVVILAAVFGFFIWRDRRRRAASGYKGVDGDEGRESLIMGMGLDNFRRKDRSQDVEAADFDERELDDLDEDSKKPLNGRADGRGEKERIPQNDSTFSLGGASSDGEASGSERDRRLAARENPGDQYNGNVTNPFEERVVNGFTAIEIATLQSRLNKQLGPEYISQRPGNGGGRVAYLEGNKAIALANEVFGFNGWSSSLGQVQIDYVDENTQNGKVSLGLSIVVRITLKDGTYHEDIGYGSIENGKGKAASFEKAKKEAATDGLKRALRTFGNVLGNCLYDKTYLKKVQSMKFEPVKFQEDNLHRHADFAPKVKNEMGMVKREAHQTPVRTNPILRTRTDHLGASVSGEFDDEFDGNLFDGVDITENPGEDFSFESVAAGSANGVNSATPSRNAPLPNGGPSRQSNPRPQNAPTARGPNGAQQPPPQNNVQNGASRPGVGPQHARAPQTPVQPNGNNRLDLNRSRMQPPTVDIHAVPKPQNPNQNAQPAGPTPPNQPLRPTPPQAQQHQQSKPAAQPSAAPATNPPSNHKPPLGFVTSRAAELFQNPDPPAALTNLPAFNPNVESPIPKEKRTPGVDHASSKPIKRDAVNAPAPPPPALGPPAGAFNRPAVGPRGNSNFVNPHQDANRRIGMPGAGMSPGGMNRGQYKPPMKRPPLQDVSNQGAGGAIGEPEAKRQRVEAPGAENKGEVLGSS